MASNSSAIIRTRVVRKRVAQSPVSALPVVVVEPETTTEQPLEVKQDPLPVMLKCIKVNGKLRVRIITRGYYNDANCQFPRDMRIEGRTYTVPAHAISLITSRDKWFYSVKNKRDITIVSDEEAIAMLLESITVYEDQDMIECAICYDQPKCMVIIPCGHYHTCNDCTNKISSCPICRVRITNKINKSMIM